MMKTENMYTLLSIDAWRDECGWTWNNWFRIESDIYLSPESTTRQILAFARRNGWITDDSKGRVTIDDDGYNLVILDKNTREPLLAFEPQKNDC